MRERVSMQKLKFDYALVIAVVSNEKLRKQLEWVLIAKYRPANNVRILVRNTDDLRQAPELQQLIWQSMQVLAFLVG
jgi:hypothetical protein